MAAFSLDLQGGLSALCRGCRVGLYEIWVVVRQRSFLCESVGIS